MPSCVKPPALKARSRIGIVAPASPVEASRLRRAAAEFGRLGFDWRYSSETVRRDGYFAGPVHVRLEELEAALVNLDDAAVCCARGGYGSAYLVERLDPKVLRTPKILLGFSDITALHIFLWQKLGWVTFYGPMAGAGFDAGAGAPGGYDAESFRRATTETRTGWSVPLKGQTLVAGEAEGILLGGCLTLVEDSLGTPWELDTTDAILLLEDRGMRSYQVDRSLLHLKQAGKFERVRGILLGEFPDSDPKEGSRVLVRAVCERILGELAMPVVWGCPIGHTPRPMLTVPLGVRARLLAWNTGQLDILEPAVIE